ncbi:MAG TPA: Rne/Rng family ribonuclease, partial [Terriglobales bacterium]
VEEEDAASESAHVAGSYVIEGGNVEHEELDAEEIEEPSYRDRIRGYHEEEENGNGENGEVFGETVRESEEERELDESEYEFGGDEFEESEMMPEPEEEAEAEGEEAEEATAPQPAPQRERFERRERRGRPVQRGRMRRQGPRHIPLISDLLKEGQEVLIQIAKDPIGKKGARITSHIALPGRFLVYMPTVNHIGVSRKISSEEERQRLKRIVGSERENGHGGFIVRTAAANIKEDELRADIRFLKHLWHEIRTRAEKSKAPSLIYHDLNLVERILRDQVTSDFSQIWVDNEQEYERVVRFASRFQPSLVRRIKLYTKDVPLYEEFGISEEINKSLKSKVWLKSGGSIVINQTEALVAIDINTGKYVGKTARLEDTIVKINCDAVKEIVRQIRLRDLGGIIVIDFIDMDERKNRQKVMQTLEEALKSDRAPSKVLQFNDFGLVAITRKRVKQSLERTLGSPCPYCEATGFVKSVTTVCNEIYVEMRKVRRHIEADVVTLRVHPDVAKELKSNNGRWLTEMEELVQHPVLIKPDALLHQEKFDINF